MDLIYKSLNRTVLYQLSRPINTVSGQTMVLDSLHKLTSNRTLIFGPKNYDTEFLVCLCYCLLQLTEEDPEKRYINQGFIVDISRTKVKKIVIFILLLIHCNSFHKCMVSVPNSHKYSYTKKKMFKLTSLYFDCNISSKSNNILYCLIRPTKRSARSSNYR